MIEYSMTGGDVAMSYLKINSSTGEIFVRSDLRQGTGSRVLTIEVWYDIMVS